MFSSELKAVLKYSNIRNTVTNHTNTISTTTTTSTTATATAIMPPHDSQFCRKDFHYNNNTNTNTNNNNNSNSLAKDKHRKNEQREFQQQQKFYIRQQFLHNSHRRNPTANNHQHHYHHQYYNHHQQTHHYHHQQQQQHFHHHQQQQMNFSHENTGNNHYNSNNNNIQQAHYNNENYDNKNRRNYQHHQHPQLTENIARFQHDHSNQSNQQPIARHNAHHSDYNYLALNPNQTFNTNPFNKNINTSREFCNSKSSIISSSTDSSSFSDNTYNNNNHIMRDMNYMGPIAFLPKAAKSSDYVSADCCRLHNDPHIALHSSVATPTFSRYSTERKRNQSIATNPSSTACERNYICSPCTEYFAANSVKLPQSGNRLKDFVVVALTSAATNQPANAHNSPTETTSVNAARKDLQLTSSDSGTAAAAAAAAASQSGPQTKESNVRKCISDSGSGSVSAVTVRNRITKQKKPEPNKKVLINSRSAVLIEAAAASRNLVDLSLLKSKNQKNNNNNNSTSPNETTLEKQQKALSEDTEMTTTSISDGSSISVVTTIETSVATLKPSPSSPPTTTTSCSSSITSAENVQTSSIKPNANANANANPNPNTKSVTISCHLNCISNSISNCNNKYNPTPNPTPTTAAQDDKSDAMGHCSQSPSSNNDEVTPESKPIKTNNNDFDEDKSGSHKTSNPNPSSSSSVTSPPTSNSYTLDFLHSVGVQMSANSANSAALKSISTENSNHLTSLAAGGSTAAVFSTPNTAAQHSRSNYTMTALAGQRQRRYLYCGNCTSHHYQPHYHHAPHPNQLTIASFLQKDLLIETLQVSKSSSSANHNMERYMNRSPIASNLPLQYSHRYHSYYQPPHYPQQKQQQQHHQPLQQHLHASKTTKNSYNMNSNSVDKSCTTNTKDKGNMTVSASFTSRNCNEKQQTQMRPTACDDNTNTNTNSNANANAASKSNTNTNTYKTISNKNNHNTQAVCPDKQPAYTGSSSASSCSSLSISSLSSISLNLPNCKQVSQEATTTTKPASNGGQASNQRHSYRSHRNHHSRHNHNHYYSHNHNQHRHSVGSSGGNTSNRQKYYNIIYVNTNERQDNVNSANAAGDNATNVKSAQNTTTVPKLTNKLSESFKGDSSSSSRLNSFDVNQDQTKAFSVQSQHCYKPQQLGDNTKDVKKSLSDMLPPSLAPCTTSSTISPPIVHSQASDVQCSTQMATTTTTATGSSASPVTSPKSKAIASNLPGYQGCAKQSCPQLDQTSYTPAAGKDGDFDNSSNPSFANSTTDQFRHKALNNLSLSSSSSATSTSTSCSATNSQDNRQQSGSAAAYTPARASLLDFKCNALLHYHNPVVQSSYNDANGSNTYQADGQHFNRNGLMHLVNLQLQSNPTNYRNAKFIEEEFLQPHLKQVHAAQAVNQFYMGISNAVANTDQQASTESSSSSANLTPNHTAGEGNGCWPTNENGSVRYNPTSAAAVHQTTGQSYASLSSVSTSPPRLNERDDQGLNAQNESLLRKSPRHMSQQQQQRLMAHQLQHPLTFPGRSASNIGSAVRSRSNSRNQSMANTSNPNTNTNVSQQGTQTSHLYVHQSSILQTGTTISNIIYNSTQMQIRSNLNANVGVSSAKHDCVAHTPSDKFLARSHLIEIKEPPSALLNNSKWDNLSQSIWGKFSSCQQSEETFKQKMHLWRYLYLFIKNTYPRYGLYLVGSTISGFGADTSDVDMCVVARTSMNIDARIESLFNLTILRDCLMKSGEFENFNLIEAKVPILRFRDRIHQLEVDLNFNNCVGIKNTHLLYCYSQMDWRLRPLVLITKLWAQYHDINNAKNMTISSYSLVLMVIHYLQYAVSPAILPCLHDIYPEKFTLLRSNDFGYVDMNETLPPYESKNQQTLGELFLGFLEYYSTFDYSQFAISVRTGGLLPIHVCRIAKALKNDIHQWKELCIEEPFDLTNTARSVYDFETFERVKAVFISSWRALQQDLDLNAIFSPISIPSAWNNNNFEQYIAAKLMLQELTLAAAAAVDSDSNNENPSGPTSSRNSDCSEPANNPYTSTSSSSTIQSAIQDVSPKTSDSNHNLQACISSTTTNTADLYS